MDTSGLVRKISIFTGQANSPWSTGKLPSAKGFRGMESSSNAGLVVLLTLCHGTQHTPCVQPQ